MYIFLSQWVDSLCQVFSCCLPQWLESTAVLLGSLTGASPVGYRHKSRHISTHLHTRLLTVTLVGPKVIESKQLCGFLSYFPLIHPHQSHPLLYTLCTYIFDVLVQKIIVFVDEPCWNETKRRDHKNNRLWKKTFQRCFSLTHNTVCHLSCIMKKTKISSLQRLTGLLISQFMPSVHRIAKEISLISPKSNN